MQKPKIVFMCFGCQSFTLMLGYFISQYVDNIFYHLTPLLNTIVITDDAIKHRMALGVWAETNEVII